MINKRKRNKGFTLIELICVICIIALIIAMIVPSIVKQIQRAERTAFDTQRKQLYNAAVMFTIDYLHTPVIWSAFAGQKPNPEIEVTERNYHDAWSLYLDEYPQDPTRAKGNTFTVEIFENGDIRIHPDTYGNE